MSHLVTQWHWCFVLALFWFSTSLQKALFLVWIWDLSWSWQHVACRGRAAETALSEGWFVLQHILHPLCLLSSKSSALSNLPTFQGMQWLFRWCWDRWLESMVCTERNWFPDLTSSDLKLRACRKQRSKKPNAWSTKFGLPSGSEWVKKSGNIFSCR